MENMIMENIPSMIYFAIGIALVCFGNAVWALFDIAKSLQKIAKLMEEKEKK
jgi:hypothetical protein